MLAYVFKINQLHKTTIAKENYYWHGRRGRLQGYNISGEQRGSKR